MFVKSLLKIIVPLILISSLKLLAAESEVVDLHIQVLSMKPKVADFFVARVLEGGDKAVDVVERLPGLSAKGKLKIEDEIRVKAESGAVAKFRSNEKMLRIHDKWRAPLGFSGELESSVFHSRIHTRAMLEYHQKNKSKGVQVFRLNCSASFTHGQPCILHRAESEEESLIIIATAFAKSCEGKAVVADGISSHYSLELFYLRENLAKQLKLEMPAGHEAAYGLLKKQGELIRADYTYAARNGEMMSCEDYSPFFYKDDKGAEWTVQVGLSGMHGIVIGAKRKCAEFTFKQYSYKIKTGKYETVNKRKRPEVIMAQMDKGTACLVGTATVIPAEVSTYIGKKKRPVEYFYVITPHVDELSTKKPVFANATPPTDPKKLYLCSYEMPPYFPRLLLEAKSDVFPMEPEKRPDGFTVRPNRPSMKKLLVAYAMTFPGKAHCNVRSDTCSITLYNNRDAHEKMKALLKQYRIEGM